MLVLEALGHACYVVSLRRCIVFDGLGMVTKIIYRSHRGLPQATEHSFGTHLPPDKVLIVFSKAYI